MTPSPSQPAASPGHSLGRSAILVLLLVGLVALIASTIFGKSGGEAAASSAVPDLSKVLLPFVAVATAIERFWETVFGWYESFALASARLIGITAQSADWIKTEFGAAEEAVTSLVNKLGQQTPGTAEYDSDYALFQKAEVRLQDAQTRINEGLKSPEYVAVKRAITLLGSLVLGLIISVSASLHLFQTAGFNLESRMDVLLTGLLIGAGPGPLHQIIGSLQEFRNALSGVANLAQGTAIKKASEAVGQSAATAGGQPMSGSPANSLNLMVSSRTTTDPAAGDPQTNRLQPAASGPDPNAPPPPINTLAVQRQATRLLKR